MLMLKLLVSSHVDLKSKEFIWRENKSFFALTEVWIGQIRNKMQWNQHFLLKFYEWDFQLSYF